MTGYVCVRFTYYTERTTVTFTHCVMITLCVVSLLRFLRCRQDTARRTSRRGHGALAEGVTAPRNLTAALRTSPPLYTLQVSAPTFHGLCRRSTVCFVGAKSSVLCVIPCCASSNRGIE